ncbi:glycosyltransferase [Indibacter alkaliphilus]|uniref:glycosyltransferase n=1 Tax=Indibacter alkaliphilus TaxID=579922 RepID=UPI0002823A1B|nr:glycosyltransferase family A protein [Indibacter alkaliphilus]
MIVISVIIPTYRDWDRLDACLQSLRLQTLDSEQFEVIIVNNWPNGPVPEIDLPKNARIINEPKPGSYAARNTGLNYAKGEILAFTDSDCLVDENWLKAALDLFSAYGEIDRLAGKIELTFERDKKSAVECYETVYAFDQKDNARKGLAVTANFFARKTLFDDIGGFDENLFSGGDYQWNRVASKKGSKIIYSENTVVKHPARNTFKQLRNKAKRVAAGQFGSQIKKEDYLKALSTLIFELRPPLFEVRKIFSSRQLSFSEKLNVWWIRYWFRSVKAIEQFIIKVSGKSAENI